MSIFYGRRDEAGPSSTSLFEKISLILMVITVEELELLMSTKYQVILLIQEHCIKHLIFYHFQVCWCIFNPIYRYQIFNDSVPECVSNVFISVNSIYPKRDIFKLNLCNDIMINKSIAKSVTVIYQFLFVR